MRTAATASTELTPTKEKQLEFWQAFADYLDERSLLPKRPKPLPQHWNNFAVGRSHFTSTATVDSNAHVIRALHHERPGRQGALLSA